MTMTENDRYHLHQQLEAALDERGANTMMELLPPVGWADVATKRDLDQQQEVTNLRFDQIQERLDLRFDTADLRLDARIAGTERRLLAILVPVIVAGIAFLAALSAWGPG
ncbi:MAG: hypothetical protein R2704_15645 [Microthrixaceae bacterium]